MAEDQKAPEATQPEPAPTDADRAKKAMASHMRAWRLGLTATPQGTIQMPGGGTMTPGQPFTLGDGSLTLK